MPKPKEMEQVRCQAAIGEHQCERPAGHTGEHREGQTTWTTGSRLQVKSSFQSRLAGSVIGEVKNVRKILLAFAKESLEVRVGNHLMTFR